MTSSSGQYPVVLDRCKDYDRFQEAGYLASLLVYFSGLNNLRSCRVLLKPNLVSSRAPLYGCTDARFIKAVGLFFKDLGAEVVLGDSPAFGSVYSVCKSKGISSVLRELDIPVVAFDERVTVELNCGIKVAMAKQALDCDLLVNLPKVKAHNQMYMTLAVKNCFGLVIGLQKALLHMKYGTGYQLFSEMIIDLQKLLPRQLVLGDGIDAMHVTGPLDGKKLNLQLVAAAENPFAFDASIFESLQLPVNRSPLMQEALRKDIASADKKNIVYPRLGPDEFSDIKFLTPDVLIPIRFNPFRFVKSMTRRLFFMKNC